MPDETVETQGANRGVKTPMEIKIGPFVVQYQPRKFNGFWDLAGRQAIASAIFLSVLAVGTAYWVSIRAIQWPVAPAAMEYVSMIRTAKPVHPELHCRGRTTEDQSVSYAERPEIGLIGYKTVGKLLLSNHGVTNGVVGYFFTDRDGNLELSIGDSLQVNRDNGPDSEVKITAKNLERMASEVSPLINSTLSQISQLRKTEPERCSYWQDSRY